MNELNLPPTHTRGETLRLAGVVIILAVVLGTATISGGGCAATERSPDPSLDSPTTETIARASAESIGNEMADPPAKQPSVGGIPLFADWPKNAKPDAVLVLSGQSYGYLQPCGCSRPQFGGIERRAHFLQSLRDKGWPVAGVDLGDVFPDKGLTEQSLLKYKTMMNGLREMGYVAVGLGKTDFAAPGGVDRLIGEYALQKEQPPFILAGNTLGVVNGKQVPREERFPMPPDARRPLVGLVEIADVGGIPVGLVGVVGKSLGEELAKAKSDPSVVIAPEVPVIQQALAALAKDPRKPQLNVLLYQGTAEEAAKLAPAVPQFQVILCQAGDPEPPQFPTPANGGKTLIVEIGHKGRFIGVLGVFKKAGGGYDLKYQLVPLGEDQITPGTDAEAFKANPTLKLLQDYAETIKARDFLGKVKQVPHPNQIREPKLNLTYIGSAKCQSCHQGESAKWSGTKHSHAMEALDKVAKRPSLRYLDPECVVCHTVGFGYNTGYTNAKDTPQLAHVGCESCHGPGSGHASDPRNANLLAMQSPWRAQPGDKLPAVAVMRKLAEVNLIDRNREEQKLPASELRAINSVSAMCMKCHDPENDPHFNIYKYWPQIYHPKPAP